MKDRIAGDKSRFLLLILITAAATNAMLYLLFYTFSLIIWSFNLNIPQQDIMPEVRWATAQKDGIESYVLYILMFVNIFFTISLGQFIEKKHKWGPVLIVGLIPFLVYFYFSHVGFNPPVIQVEDNLYAALLLVVAVSLVMLLASFMYDKYNKALTIVFAVLLVPICFVATSPISINDYSYIIDPALRILKGVSISNIYFQYDIFMSLLAAVWIKLKLDFNHFQVLGQLSSYLFIFGAYFLSRRLFYSKKIAIYIFIALVLLRLYANETDLATLIQVSSLRLDWWILIVALVYYYGAYHWAVGVLVGILLIITRTFGLIYFAAYLELLFVLLVVDIFNVAVEKRWTWIEVKGIFRVHMVRSFKNISIMLVFFLLGALFFNGFINEQAAMYRQLGIGFLKISPQSFYWYVPIIFSVVFGMLLFLRKRLSSNYFTSGLFLILLAIGNSLYFFGRSHEHNIINIDGILVFVLFMLFDILYYMYSDDREENTERYSFKRVVFLSLPIIFVIASTLFYSGRIISKVGTQYHNLLNGRFVYPLQVSVDDRIVKEITKGSHDVYFLSHVDSLYYYSGYYTPLGYFSPYSSWLLKKDAIAFLQGLLDKHYYLVWDGTTYVEEIVQGLEFDATIKNGKYLAIWKR